MDVKDRIQLNKNHSIEWGQATWDATDSSIRNRYDSDSGRFNKAGSGEIPWEDFKLMVLESIKKGHFSNGEMSEILREIANKI